MSKKYIRYFGGFIESEQRWLNTMSAKGYRLSRTGKLWFEFEECEPNQYEYYIDFAGHKSNGELERYTRTLRDFGYRVITKNKKLFIIERHHDDRPFASHTTIEDKITYYKPQRDAHFILLLLSLFLFIRNSFVKGEWGILSTWLFLLAAVITIFSTLFYQKHINQLKKEAE
ncbi:DUF2812 domain-containing protein [Paenibacillus sp. EC2-1]|uniref:DUF2812 domain-containing protein n=1 Tax=Paenibacillus sp. EC2-1 TaxID=3388665 RepID=UPI003BEF26E1